MPPEYPMAGPVEAAPPRDEIPVARPARPPSPPPPDDPPEWPALTPGAVKGWATSLALHAVLLIVLGLWVFSTRVPPSQVIDTRLQALGDPNGVEGGTTLVMGGRDDPISLPRGELPKLRPAIAPPESVEPGKVDRPTLKGFTRTGPKLGEAPDDDGTIKIPGRGGGLGGEGFGLARFGRPDGSIIKEKIQGVDVKVGDPQFTLLWDTQADLDLHVIEPGGAEYSWINPTGWDDDRGKGGLGGELDVDNKEGFGPENVYWVEERGDDGKVQTRGRGPAGEYRWFVHYYGGRNVIGQDAPTRWKVRVKQGGKVTLFEGTLRKRQRSKVYTFHLGPPTASPAAEATDEATEPPARSPKSSRAKGEDRDETGAR